MCKSIKYWGMMCLFVMFAVFISGNAAARMKCDVECRIQCSGIDCGTYCDFACKWGVSAIDDPSFKEIADKPRGLSQSQILSRPYPDVA